MALLRHLRRLKMRIKNVLFNNMQQFCLSKLGFYNNLLYDQTYGKKPETFRKKQTNSEAKHRLYCYISYNNLIKTM